MLLLTDLEGRTHLITLIRIPLSEYYYQFTIILDLIEFLIQSGSPDNVMRIQHDILDRDPVVDIHYFLLSEILLTNKQTDKRKFLSTQKLELSTLASLAKCSYRLSYRAILI